MNVAAQVLRRFRYDLLALAVVTTVMSFVVKDTDLQSVSAVMPLMGIVVSIFIGFRNRNAYNRWWEARTLWTGVLSNGRSLNYALIAYQDGTPELTAITDRMRRREVRHARQLAAELQDTAAPADPTATELQTRQASDIGELARAGLIDRQARRVLIMLNATQVGTAAGLERIRRQPVPRFYDFFTRGLAWLFAVIVCTRLDVGGHDSAIGVALGLTIMVLVIIAERVGALLEEPMSNGVFGLPLDRYCAELAADLTPGKSDGGTVFEESESEGRQ